MKRIAPKGGLCLGKAVKTNVMRRLEAERVPFEARFYPVDEAHLDGLHAAEALGLDPAMVFKTLVLSADHGEHLVCVIPVAAEVDLKAAAAASISSSVRSPPPFFSSAAP